jgi:hypothetical protein
MGTSRNDPSPDIPPWRRARAVLGNPHFSVSQQGAALWQAAIAERGEELRSELSDPVLARACLLADRRSPVVETLRTFDNVLFDNRSASVTLEFARRALGRAALTREGARGFAAELFAEITAYYASRDLPSVVAAPNRLPTVSESIRLTHELRSTVRERVRDLGEPGVRPRAWARYVQRVLGALRSAPR